MLEQTNRFPERVAAHAVPAHQLGLVPEDLPDRPTRRIDVLDDPRRDPLRRFHRLCVGRAHRGSRPSVPTTLPPDSGSSERTIADAMRTRGLVIRHVPPERRRGPVQSRTRRDPSMASEHADIWLGRFFAS
jgi:hypothetical protein